MKDDLKISLSFNHACKLNDDQKIKLITCQARKLSIENWEIEALLKLCKSNGWMNKGLALLYEYAGYMDELRILVNDRSEIIEELLDLLDSEIFENQEIIIYKIQYVSELTAKIIMKLSKWRQLQWIPRPLYFTDFRGTDKISIQFLLKEEASLLFHAITNKKKLSHEKYLIDLRPSDIVFLLVPYLDYSEFTTKQQQVGFDPLNGNDYSSLEDLYSISREILLIEDRIDASWKSVNVAFSIYGNDSLSTLYPTLRLPYNKKNSHPPTEDLAWFENLSDKYKLLCTNMTTVFSSFNENHTSENQELKSKVSSGRRIAIANKIENSKMELSTTSSSSKLSPRERMNKSQEIFNTTDIATHETDEEPIKYNTIIKTRRNQAVNLELPNHNNNNNNNNNSENSSSEISDLRKRSVTIATVGHAPDPSITPNLETNRRVTHAGEMHATSVAPNSLLTFRENSCLLLETSEEDQNDRENFEDDILSNNLIGTIERNVINVGGTESMLNIETTCDVVKTQYDPDATYTLTETSDVIDLTEENLRSRTSSVEYIFEDDDDLDSYYASSTPISGNNTTSLTRNRSLSSPAISTNFPQRSQQRNISPSQHHTNKLIGSNVVVSKNRKSSPFSQKLIRAANRLPIYQDEDGNSLELETLQSIGILDTLSRPFTRAESRKELGIISSVLSKLTINDDTISQFAVRKIIIWWRLIAPQKKLLRRMQALNICKDILRNIVDSSVIVGIARQRRRIKLLRYGACMTIQRYFRHYYNLVLIKDKLTKQKLRRDKAWDFLNIWRLTILSGIRIYKYIQYNKNKKIIKTKCKEKGIQLYRRILMYYINIYVFNNKILHEKYDVQKINGKQLFLYREKQYAAIIIQKYVRRHSVIISMLKRSVMNVMISKITFFFIKCIARKRVRNSLLKKRAALKLQRFIRGALVRQHILKIVSSGLKLKTSWKKHKAYINLKAQLRRVDRPYTLIMHGIRNIQKKSVSSHQMRFKVSAWWHPLLHIVNHNDVDVIINTKQPQLIYSSICYEFQNSSGSSRRLSIVQGIRKISNIFISKSNERNSVIALPSISSLSDISSLQRKVSINPSADMFAIAKQQKHILPPIKSRTNSSSSMLSVDFRPSSMIRQSALMGYNNFDDDDDDDEEDDDHDITTATANAAASARDSFATNAASRRSFLLKRMVSHANDLKSSTIVVNNNNLPHRTSTTKQKHSIATITMMASSRNLIKETPLSAIYKTKAKTFLSRFSGISSGASPSKQPELQHDENKLICNFEDNAIKIPGCHGNSVIKFEIFDGERLFGYHIFYMNREGEMMYWGGEYNKKIILHKEQRRVVQGKLRKDSEAFSDDPILDFRINAGPPLRAKCSWGRLAVRGNGPLKRLLKARRFLSSFIFDKWHRFYFSLDEIGLSLFDNKFNTTAAHIILVKDFKEISVDIGAPIRESSIDAAKNIVEDIHNVKLITYTGDEIYMRFPDAGTRIGWQDVLCNAISYYSFNKEQQLLQGKNNLKFQNPSWRYLNTIQESSNYIKNSGMLATSVKIEGKNNNSPGKYFSIFSKRDKVENKSIDKVESISNRLDIASKSTVRLSLVENRRRINTITGQKIN